MLKLPHRIWLTFLTVCFLPLTQVFAATSLKIDVDTAALRVTYGAYAEIALNLTGAATGDITWQTDGTSGLPAGFEFSASNTASVLVFGTPVNSGEWCTTVIATDAKKVKASRQLCFFTDDDANDQYPKFVADAAVLDTATVGKSYSTELDIDPASLSADPGVKLDSDQYDGTLPKGLALKNQIDQNKILVTGKPGNSGTSRFSLRLFDSAGNVSYRQFKITIDKTTQVGASCPAGYYYDENLGYCVQANLDPCAEGSYYDSDDNACVAYPAPPPTVTCQAGQYFDPYLGYCAWNGTPRCPWDYHWDRYGQNCERDDHECPIGTRYNWGSDRCELIWEKNCGAGSHWDAHHARCEQNWQSCAPGYYWDNHDNRCEQSGGYASCGAGTHWNAHDRRCEANGLSCGPGYHYNPGSQNCQMNPQAPSHCGTPGSHWDGHSCQPNIHPKPQPPHPGHPGHPVPHPGHPGPGGQPPKPLPPHPHPPGPHPQPPHPKPTPAPGPQPTPVPHPGPHPGPGHPHPTPAPGPQPTPAPHPHPQPPHPKPTPAPGPQPTPAPHPHPGPGPGHPNPGQPHPHPTPNPGQPHPHPGPGPGHPNPGQPHPHPTPNPGQPHPHPGPGPGHPNPGQPHPNPPGGGGGHGTGGGGGPHGPGGGGPGHGGGGGHGPGHGPHESDVDVPAVNDTTN